MPGRGRALEREGGREGGRMEYVICKTVGLLRLAPITPQEH